MKKILLSVLVITSMFGFSSCEKEEDPIDVTKNAYLFDRTWKLTGELYCADLDVEVPVYTDVYATLPDCYTDNFYFFNTKSTCQINDYWLKCSSTNPDITEVNFLVSNEDTYIKFYTNPDDIDNSIFLQGVMTTPDIEHFVITHTYWDEGTEKNVESIYYFEKFTPDF